MERLPAEIDRITQDFGLFSKRILQGEPPSLSKMIMQKRFPLPGRNPAEVVIAGSDEDIRKVYEFVGPDYGTGINKTAHAAIMREMLSMGIENKRTLSVGAGISPYEIYLAKQGIIKEPIIATDFAQGMLDQGAKIAKDEGVETIEFVNKAGDQLDYRNEFGQVLIIDSLHWMKSWRECLKRSAAALEVGGTIFIAYSSLFERTNISPIEAVGILLDSGMEIPGIMPMPTISGTARTVITARKELSPIEQSQPKNRAERRRQQRLS